MAIAPVDFAILSLAVWRVAHMLAREDGPFDVFCRLRLAMGAVKSINGFWTADAPWGKLWICPLCLSVWLAALFLLAYWLTPWLWWAILLLAVSGAACILELLTARK